MNARAVLFSVGRISLAVILIVGIALGGFVWNELDWYPLNAFAWHLRHGNQVTVGEFRVPVSFWVRPEHRYGPNEVSIDLLPGRLRSGSVSFEVGRPGPSGKECLQAVQLKASSPDKRIATMASDYLRMPKRVVNIGGQPSLCIDEGIEISCMPLDTRNGLRTRMLTFPSTKKEDTLAFYQLLSRVTRETHHP